MIVVGDTRLILSVSLFVAVFLAGATCPLGYVEGRRNKEEEVHDSKRIPEGVGAGCRQWPAMHSAANRASYSNALIVWNGRVVRPRSQIQLGGDGSVSTA